MNNHTPTILLVEDEGIIAMAEAETLRGHGFNVITALSGEAAIGLAEKSAPDLVLMDVDLGGGMDGTEAAQKILEKRNLPVVFLSSHTEPGIVERTEKITSYGYVVKNSGETVLVTSIKMALRLFDAHRRIEERDRALQESEERNRIISGLTTDYAFIVEVDPEGGTQLSWASDTFQRVTGRSMDSVRTPNDWSRVIHPEDLRKFNDFMRHVISGREQGELECRSLRQGNEERWLHIVAYPRETGNGALSIVGAVKDITERRKAQIKAELVDKKFIAAFGMNPDPTCISDPVTGTIIDVNNAYVSWSGYTREELIGRTTVELGLWQDPSARDRMMQLLKEKGEVNDIELHLRSRNGTPYSILFSARLFPVSGGTYLLTRGHDVTAQKRIEEERARLLAILEGTSDLIATAASDGTITYVNRAGRRVMGWSDEEDVTRHSITEAHDEGSIKTIMETGIPAALEHGIWEGETTGIGKDGKEFPVSQVIIAHRAEDGALEYLSTIIRNISERKKLEVQRDEVINALLASEERFSLAFNNNPNAIAIVSEKDLRFVKINDAFANMYGYAQPELLGRPAAEFNLMPDRKQVGEVLTLLSDKGQVLNYEHTFRHKDGTTGYGLVSAVRYRAGGEEFILYEGTDITELVIARNAREQSEEKFTLAFDNSPSSLAIVTFRDRRFIEINDSFRKTFGYTREEIIGRTVHDYPIITDMKAAGEMKSMLDSKRNLYNYESSFRRKNGETGHSMISAVHITIAGEECILYQTVDITELAQAREQLEQSEKKFSAAMDMIPDPVALSEMDSGRIIEVNSAFVKWMGAARKDLVGRTSVDIGLWLDPNSRSGLISRLKKKGELLNFEAKIITKKGDVRTALCSVRRMKMEDRDYIFTRFNDITDRAEVGVRLARAVEEKEALMRELQHRMKNSLAMIKSLVSLEMSRTSDDATIKTLEDIRDRIGSMAGLYTLLLNSGSTQEVRLDDYVAGITTALSDAYIRGRRNINLEARCDPAILDVKRSMSMGLIINELVTNALKYAFPGDRGGTIRVDLKHTENELLIEIGDNGKGLPGKFSIETHGGLGLRIVNMLVSGLGGTISLEREGGALYRIRVPL